MPDQPPPPPDQPVRDHHANSGSFAHAFIPGLILGLVIGAVAGAFLPDWIGGPKIPAPTGEVVPGAPMPREGERSRSSDEFDPMIEDADPDAPNPDGTDTLDEAPPPAVPRTTPPA